MKKLTLGQPPGFSRYAGRIFRYWTTDFWQHLSHRRTWLLILLLKMVGVLVKNGLSLPEACWTSKERFQSTAATWSCLVFGKCRQYQLGNFPTSTLHFFAWAKRLAISFRYLLDNRSSSIMCVTLLSSVTRRVQDMYTQWWLSPINFSDLCCNLVSIPAYSLPIKDINMSTSSTAGISSIVRQSSYCSMGGL